MADIRQIESQKRFEANAIQEGVDAYKRAFREAAFADTVPGLIVARDMVENMLPAIAEAQKVARDGLRAKGAPPNPPEWWWLIGWLTAEKTAFITARSLLTRNERYNSGDTIPVTSAALYIGQSLKTEIEFDNWKRQEAKAVRAGDKATDMFKLLTSREKQLTPKTFDRWRRKIESIEREDWTHEMKIIVGTKLIDIAIQHGGGWFYRTMLYRRGKRIATVGLTEVALSVITDINAQSELNRPMLRPMIAPPKPWRRI